MQRNCLRVNCAKTWTSWQKRKWCRCILSSAQTSSKGFFTRIKAKTCIGALKSWTSPSSNGSRSKLRMLKATHLRRTSIVRSNSLWRTSPSMIVNRPCRPRRVLASIRNRSHQFKSLLKLSIDRDPLSQSHQPRANANSQRSRESRKQQVFQLILYRC